MMSGHTPTEHVTTTTTSTATSEEPATATPAHQAGWALVGAVQQGDSDAFGKLYDSYVDLVFRFVLYRVHDRTLAEDITSETFLRALRRISSISYQGRDIGAWFITIARNLVLDHVKSSRYRLEVTTAQPADPAALPRQQRAATGPESQVLANAASAELLRCIRQLGADQQECVILRFLHGFSVAETASAMERNEGAIKALQHRAVRRLAQLLPTTCAESRCDSVTISSWRSFPEQST